MAITYSTALRNRRADGITTELGGLAKIKLYTVADVLLVTGVCSNPIAPAAASGVLTFSAITAGTTVAAGTATKATITKSDDTVVISGLVVTAISGSGDVKLDDTNVLGSGQVVNFSSCIITQGNP